MRHAMLLLPLVAGCSLVSPAELQNALDDAVPFAASPLETPGGVDGCGTTVLRFTTDVVFAQQTVTAEVVLGDRDFPPIDIELERGTEVAVGTLELDTDGVAFQTAYAASVLLSHQRSEQVFELVYADLPEVGPIGFTDRDGDGAGAEPVTRWCEGAFPTEADDCDDDDPTRSPSAFEVVADGIDQDCDGQDLCFVDLDGDGFGSGELAPAAADGCSVGLASVTGDCDDATPLVAPGLAEACDGLDNDCDAATGADEGDLDSDGHLACSGFVDRGLGLFAGDDCDDDDPYRFPGNPEVCDGLDNDCSGALDSDEADDDGDGYLVCSGFVDQGSGALGGEDCDDAVAAIHPNAPELCDGLDSDCDGALTAEEADLDADGFAACDTPVPPLVGGDCADDDRFVNPDAAEVCDGVRNDCNAAAEADAGAAPFMVRLANSTPYEGPDFDAAWSELSGFGGELHLCADVDQPAVTYAIGSVDTTIIGHPTASGHPATFTGRLELSTGDHTIRSLTMHPGDGDASTDGGVVHAHTEGMVFVEESTIDCLGAPRASRGGAIFAEDLLVVRNTAIRNCAADNGGALYARVIDLDGATLENNDAVTGGAVTLLSDGTNSAMLSSGSALATNSADADGGAIHFENNSLVELSTTTFTSNTAGGNGGAIHRPVAVDDYFRLEDVTFDGNIAGQSGGALFLSSGGLVELLDLTVLSNVAVMRGGGIYANENTADIARIDGGTWQGNEADRGGAMHFEGPGWTVQNATIRANVASDRGAGIRLEGAARVDVSSTRFELNEAPFGRSIASGGALTLFDTHFLPGTATTSGTARIVSSGAIVATGLDAAPTTGDEATLSLFANMSGTSNGTLDCTDCVFHAATVRVESGMTVPQSSQEYVYDGVIPSLQCDAAGQSCIPVP